MKLFGCAIYFFIFFENRYLGVTDMMRGHPALSNVDSYAGNPDYKFLKKIKHF
jgi:hypothetical protein